MHMDVLGSYSWSYNVSGLKLWWLFHEEDTHCLKQQKGHAQNENDVIPDLQSYHEDAARVREDYPLLESARCIKVCSSLPLLTQALYSCAYLSAFVSIHIHV